MTHFLASEQKPEGFKLEEVLSLIRADLIKRAGKIADDRRPEALQVLENDIKILALLSECVQIAEGSSSLLNRSFGPHSDAEPRIGA